MDSDLKKAYLYCQSLARTEAGNFYWAFRFLPKMRRWALSAVYAFCRMADDLVDQASNPENARHDLWKMLDDLDIALCSTMCVPPMAGHGQDAHDTIFLALADACRRFDIPRQPFEDLIRGVEMDVDGIEYDSIDDLETYCRRVASSVGQMSIAIFGAKHPDSKKYADELGMALQWTNILRDVGEDADRGRVYIPNSMLRQYLITRDDVLGKSNHVPFDRLFDEVYQQALNHYLQADRILPTSDLRRLVPAEIMKAIYFATLRRIRLLWYPVLHRRVSLSILTKIGISLRVVLSRGILGLHPNSPKL
jgi:phytoene synthase